MADRNSINQRIALEGGDVIKKQLDDVGDAGEKAFARLKGAANEANTATQDGVPSLGAIDLAAKRAGISVEEFRLRTAATKAELAGMLPVTSVAGAGVTQLGGALLSLGQGAGVIGGIVGLLAAVGGVAIKVSDDATKLKDRLNGLAGVKVGEQLAADLKKASDQLGVLPKELEPALESLIKAKQLQNDIINALPNGGKDFPNRLSGGAIGDPEKLTQTLKTMFEILRNGGADTA